jgi:hypothetical protein
MYNSLYFYDPIYLKQGLIQRSLLSPASNNVYMDFTINAFYGEFSDKDELDLEHSKPSFMYALLYAMILHLRWMQGITLIIKMTWTRD